MSDEILSAFAVESAENIEDIEEAIDELSRGREGAIDRLFRLVHTLKGSASIVGLGRLEAFAHAWETRLGTLRAGTATYSPPVAGALLACRDHVAHLVEIGRPELGADRGEEPAALSRAEEAILAALDESLASVVPPSHAEIPAAPAEDGLQAASPETEDEQRRSSGRDASHTRVASAKLETILAQSSELVQAISALGLQVKALDGGQLIDQVQVLHAQASQLYRQILEIRTVPFGEVASRYRRVVEDIAGESGKSLRFELSGADTEIDKALADRLAEPLLHLVRNAADHGVEAPATRLAAGKPSEGLVALRARREAGALVVLVEDDGQGIDPGLIRTRARALGLGVDSLCDEALFGLLFRPGFSLSERVTKWSGRGVGLDVVERAIKDLRGSIRLASRPGQGFSAEIRLPLALSLVEGFTARAGETDLLVPFESVRSCIPVAAEGEGRGILWSIPNEGCLLPVIDLDLLYHDAVGRLERIVVVIEADGLRVGLALDAVGEVLSAAVRPLNRHFADPPGISGIASLGDGSLVLALDPAELVRLARDMQKKPLPEEGAVKAG